MFDDIFVASMRQKLLAEQDRLEYELRRLHRPLSVTDPQDVDEQAEIVEELSVQSGEADILESELEHIQKTLEKIDDGSFGKCEQCHRYINQKRLEATPTARLCEQCGE